MYPVMDFLTTADMLQFFGIASGVLSAIAFLPYILDTHLRKTQPQRASWLIWSVLGAIAFGSQVFEGATSSLWFAGVQVSGTIIVLLLSIRVGIGKFLSKSDHLILLAAGAGLLLWYFTDNAAYALAITISISLLGGLATAIKAYRDPDSETLTTWVVSFVASICAIFSVGAVDLTLLAYPLYLFTLYLAFIVAIVLGRARERSVDQAMTPSTRSLSFAGLFSGLRTTADAVIVTAAFVFAFDWFGANSFAVDVVTADSSNSGETTSLADNRYSGTYSKANHVEPVELFSVSARIPQHMIDIGGAGTLSGESFRTGMPVIVIAIDRGSDLTDSESVEEILQHIGAIPDAVILNEMDSLPVDTIPMPGVPDFDASIPSIADNSNIANKALTNAPVLVASPSLELPLPVSVLAENSADFLLLDADDPFAKLVVTGDMARLVAEESSMLPIDSHNRLQRGRRILALATNGEWFKVRLSNGLQGFVHHSEVSVEALSSLRTSRPG